MVSNPFSASSQPFSPSADGQVTYNNIGGGVGGGNGGGSGFFGGYGYAYNGVGMGSSTVLALPGKKEPMASSALRRKISGEFVFVLPCLVLSSFFFVLLFWTFLSDLDGWFECFLDFG